MNTKEQIGRIDGDDGVHLLQFLHQALLPQVDSAVQLLRCKFLVLHSGLKLGGLEANTYSQNPFTGLMKPISSRGQSRLSRGHLGLQKRHVRLGRFGKRFRTI